MKVVLITDYEFHYSLYEKVTFTQHVDQFQNNSSRKYSMSYLNSDWQPADGGELFTKKIETKNYAHARKDCFF
jgi:SM-20-related protein